VNHLPNGVRFTTPEGFQFGVITPSDMQNAWDLTTCSHGCTDVVACRQCSVAAMFHRQILRMCQWMQRQYETDWEPDAARQLADEKTLEQCGFLPKMKPAPAEADVPPLPPIELRKHGLIARPAPLEGNAGNLAALVIQTESGLEPNQVQRALLDAIANGERWKP
jgi:hypothetical protein